MRSGSRSSAIERGVSDEGFYVASDEKRPYHTRIHHAAAGTATTHNPAGAHSREFPRNMTQQSGTARASISCPAP
jgi:hypothetical protein